MNVNVLIDSVVKQTTILIAQLATSAGLRAPLANIANAVFLELADELESQGVSRKIAADMFGLALRSYQSKVSRLAARKDDEHLSVWEAVFEFVREREVVSRADIFLRFVREDEELLRGILRDLVDSGLVFRKGRGDGTVYRLASDDDFERVAAADAESNVPLVWIHVYLNGPATLEQLVELSRLDKKTVRRALKSLVDEGRVTASDESPPTYHADVVVLPVGEGVGWEAALFDHFNAVVTALCVKLRNVSLRALPDDVVGGSTYSFEIWDGHPFGDRVLGLLKNTRRDISTLRAEVDDFNESANKPARRSKVTFYFGQSVVSDELGEDDP